VIEFHGKDTKFGPICLQFNVFCRFFVCQLLYLFIQIPLEMCQRRLVKLEFLHTLTCNSNVAGNFIVLLVGYIMLLEDTRDLSFSYRDRIVDGREVGSNFS